jgi:hypothetical protein
VQRERHFVGMRCTPDNNALELNGMSAMALIWKMIGAGTPRALQDAVAGLFFVLLRHISLASADRGSTGLSLPAVPSRTRDLGRSLHRKQSAENDRLDTGC